MSAEQTWGSDDRYAPGARIRSRSHPEWGFGTVLTWQPAPIRWKARDEGDDRDKHVVNFESIEWMTFPVLLADDLAPVTPAEERAAAQKALLDALHGIADRIAEGNEQRHADAIDLANAVATLTGQLTQSEPIYVATHLTWWGHLRALFGGAR